ncbi:MAG: hypothetical protein IPK82_06315 [Polyangiaceae bacterium]|nr:hypothetical protein [Polyangiaceae bacterium]
MRKKIITFVLVAALIGWVAMLVIQKRGSHQAPAEQITAVSPTSSAAASASPSASASGSPGSSSTAAGSAGVPLDSDAGAPKLMDRSLRVIALGWDLAAPGVLANGGVSTSKTSDFATSGLDVQIAVATTPAPLEAALARGGEDKDGADVAILPLPTFVAAYERLRALSLDMFFVVGWSRGREAIASTKNEWPSKGEIKLAGSTGHPATFLALWAFDLGTIAPSQVKLLSPGAPASDAPIAAIDRSSALPPDTSRNALLLTTADAPKLIPYVAVAPRGFIEQRSRALTTWASSWLAGARKLAQDAPGGARVVATSKDAPEPIALLQTLGQSVPATLADNVRAAGLSGRGAVTLDTLFQRSWAIWRAAGVLATPSPEATPISTAVINALARAEPSQAGSVPDDAKPRDAGTQAKVLLTYRQPDGKFDEASFVATAGLLAGVFERAPLRLGIGGAAIDKNRTKKALDDVSGRFGLPQGRLTPATKTVSAAAAFVEVLAVP